jgi:hypothetical protein
MFEKSLPEPIGDKAVKPDIFAFPNQTNVVFGLIVVVLLGAMVIGSIDSSPIPIWPLTLILIFLSWRAYLRYPEIEIAQEKASISDNDFPLLQERIARLTEELGLSRKPILVIAPKNGMRTVGTLRRWYLFVGHDEAKQLQQDLQHENSIYIAEAKLIHELYHFKTGDHWRMNYVRQLLRYTFLLLGWAILFFFGFSLLLIIAITSLVQLDPSELVTSISTITPEIQQMLVDFFPSASEIEEVQAQAAEINLGLMLSFVFSSFLPFLIVGIVLRAVFWPKLWRTREVYADAGVVKSQDNLIFLLSNLTSAKLQLNPITFQHMLQASPICNPKLNIREWWHWLRHIPKKHYDTATRIDHIMNPSRVFDCWFNTAVFIGPLILLLDILLASPLTLLYVGNWPMHFSTTIIFAVVSLNLIPELVLGRPAWSYMIKVIMVVVGLRLIWVLLTVGLLLVLLILAPATLNEMMAMAVAAVAGYAGRSADLYYDDLGTFVVQASILNLAQVFIIFLILALFLTVIIALVRRLLTWYRLPEAEKQLVKIAYAVIGIGILFLILTVLPLISTALLEPANLFNPTLIITAGFGLTVTAVASLLFFYADRKYAGYCPHCGAIISKPYVLGKRCTAVKCGKFLHHWLIAGGRL